MAISPRRRCRADTRDSATGEWRHDYRDAPLPADPGRRPVAIYLTDSPSTGLRRHRLLAFDLDARRGDVEADLARLRQLLDQAGIPHVVAESGPGGGRHVWASAGTAGAEPGQVASVARALAAQLPTLDVAPLTNPVTGAVRPPGSPHRNGGHAQLLDPPSAAAARDRLQHCGEQVVDRLATVLDLLDSTDGRPTGNPAAAAARVTHLDGGPALPGDPRPVPARILRQLTSSPGPDASAALARVLVGLALARWSWPMVAALLPDTTARGLEHARTRRSGSTRHPRPAAAALALLQRQWARAVAHAAAMPDRDAGPRPQEPTAGVDTRLNALIAVLQTRADREPGRWARPSGPADRGVLDALCLVALTCRSATVDLDVRRAGQLAGVSPATAARALHRLSLDGWISLALPAEGRRAARWTLVDPFQHRGETQAPHPPPSPGGELETLRQRAAVRGADLFAPRPAGGLGRHAARIALAVLSPTAAAEVVTATGYTMRTVQQGLRRLGELGVLGGRGHRPVLHVARLVRAARKLGVHGYRAAQAHLIAVDRELWAWWHEELGWMHAPERWRRPALGQQTMAIAGGHLRPPFPRRLDGRADYPAARLHVLRDRGLGPSQVRRPPLMRPAA